jgi:hypothetical protein
MLLWHDATSRISIDKKIKEVKGFLDNPYFKKMRLLKSPVDSRNLKKGLLG